MADKETKIYSLDDDDYPIEDYPIYDDWWEDGAEVIGEELYGNE